MAEVEKNLRWWGRAGRYSIGLILVAWAIAGGPWWAYAGLYLLATASFGYCPVYWLLRVKPSRSKT